MTPPGHMLSVAEALATVLAQAHPLHALHGPITNALGQVLAENILADIDLPPFDKSVVDGFALRADDLAGTASVRLRVVETIYAGKTPTHAVGPGEAAAIMTGAPLPQGADAVVMVEKTVRADPDFVLISGPVHSGQNRLVKGREMRAGEIVVPRGSILDAGKLGVMASVGANRFLYQPRPIVSIVSTGDELVPFDQAPGPGQIRNSNTMLLAALVQEHNATARPQPIAADQPKALRDAFIQALEGTDILLISGGVSAGKLDLVPETLEALGIRCLFHKVKVKPGKPLWFGVGPDRADGPPPLVFGLPGNPVSGLVSFLLFVRPTLAALSQTKTEPIHSLPLAATYRHSDDRDTYRPARLIFGPDGIPEIEPLNWAGSSDLRGVAAADGFAIFIAGERIHEKGERIGFLSLHPSRSGLGHSYYT